MYTCINFASFYEFYSWFWNCNESVVFVFHFIRVRLPLSELIHYIEVLVTHIYKYIIVVFKHVSIYRMSSNLRSIAYDLHYCPGSKNYRRHLIKWRFLLVLWFPQLIKLIITKRLKVRLNTHNPIQSKEMLHLNTLT
jgi:hypothetical protein